MSSPNLNHKVQDLNTSASAELRRGEMLPVTPLKSDEQWAVLARDLVATVKTHVPDWTDSASHDPGVNLLELFAFLTSELIARQRHTADTDQPQSDESQRHPIPSDGNFPSTWKPLRRNRYFAGRLLTADDFQAEQDYLLNKQRIHNLSLHGIGVVSGLDVHLHSSDNGGQGLIVVEPGFALDPKGEEIIVCEHQSVSLPANVTTCFVSVLRVDIPVDDVLAMEGQSDNEPARIEERSSVQVSATVPEDGVTIAKLDQHQSVWRIDPDFHPLRSR